MKLDGLGGLDEIVSCAHCGCESTHHYAVETYARIAEDSNRGGWVRAMGNCELGLGPSVWTDGDAEMDDCPSGRRNGVRIWLTCEECPEITALTLGQHKGSTLLDVVAVERGHAFIPRHIKALNECKVPS